jgi:hypothetical protein
MSNFPPALPERDLITTTSATDIFQSAPEFVLRLRLLRQLRRERKLELRDRVFRKSLSSRVRLSWQEHLLVRAMQQYVLLQRNLIYTGITRGKRLLVLIGQKKALGNSRPQRPTPAAVLGAAG